MKCPNCMAEMEKGVSTGNLWFPGNWLRSKMMQLNLGGGTKVYAFKCPDCGKIELQAEKSK